MEVLASPRPQCSGWKPSGWTKAIWALVDTFTTALWSRSWAQHARATEEHYLFLARRRNISLSDMYLLTSRVDMTLH